MKNFSTLFKLLIKNDFKKDKSKKSFKFNNALVGEIIIGAIIIAAMIGVSLTIGVYLNDIGLGAEFLGILFLVAQFMVLIFGTMLLLSTMYFSKDISFLLPLPVKTSTIFWAKFAYIYVRELLFAGLMVLIGGGAFLIAVSAPAGSYFLLILGALIVPCLPLMLASILSFPIIYISGYFKSKGLILAIILTLVFSAVMFVYLYFMNSMPFAIGEGGFTLPAAAQDSLRNFFNIFIPVGSLTKLILLREALINLGYVAASYAVLIALILLLSKLTFKKSIQKQLEEPKGRVSQELKYSKNTAVKSIIKKDFKEIMRNPGLAFNCLATVVLAPVFLTVFGLISSRMSDITGGAEDIGGTMFLVMGLAFLTMFSASTNMTGLSSITREGKNFYHIKTLPVDYNDVLRAKIILTKIFSFTGIILSAVPFMIFVNKDTLSILTALGIIIFALLFTDGFVHYIVLLDLKAPKLNYENITAALKNSKNSILSLLVSLGLILPAIAGLVIVLLVLSESMDVMLLWTIIFVPLFIYALVLNFVFRRKIKNDGIAMLEQIEP